MIKVVESIVVYIGEKVAYLNVLLILLIGVDVTFRYIFDSSKNWILELEWHLFALIFLMGSAYALQAGKHVRVDLFYNKFSDKTKATIDILGTLLFLIPWCIVVMKTSWIFVESSWYMKEGSPNPGGLPARYLIKGSIILAFGILMIQGFAILFKELSKFKNNQWK